ncbi:MAG: ABC transporter permease [Tannerella sp.]|jgi:ABC-type transport system involved in multi-copper enzyme maturation permease subunit|nr:ABC transporter permease [Tannerella sp.]
MLGLENIRSVAKYESKLLTRSWFYRIFLILITLFITIWNLSSLLGDSGGGTWILKSIPSNIPYINLLFLNTGQAIIAVFLSSEFLKADKKLDTSEVFYVHPLSNAEYVAGKIWGNLKVFIRLDFIMIGIALLFNIMSGIYIDWAAYIIYFFIICIPTLVFILGLSVGLMLIFKNQAITFVVLLGYIALTLFYIGDKLYFLFDYMVYTLPLVKSTIAGFTNIQTVINHRLIYLFIGLGFLCLSVFKFRRLPNTKYGDYRWMALAIVFILAGCYSAYNHVNTILGNQHLRAIYVETNNQHVNDPKLTVTDYDIYLEQQRDIIKAEATITGFVKQNAQKFTFCLNPKLKVTEVSWALKQECAFERDNQILTVDLGQKLNEGDTIKLVIKYEGVVDDRFCNLDIPSELINAQYASNAVKINKKYAFHNPDYLLFTPESYWYPQPGVAYSNENPDWQQTYFSNYNLTVKTLPGLTAVSQGALDTLQTADNIFKFKTDFRQPSITLAVGDYMKKSIDVDSTEFVVQYLRGHDYFVSVFDSIIDTIPAQIRERRRYLETSYKLNYSFKRFTVVEVPVQFYSYVHTWSQAQEKMQPEMILYPEKGCLFGDADFENRYKQHKTWSRRGGQEISDKEARIRTLNAFLFMFQNKESNVNFQVERGAVNITTQPNPFFIFPQLYNFRYNIFSSEWTVANRLIELYLQDETGSQNNWQRQTNGISNDEKANLLMKQYAFKDMLNNVEHRDILNNVITLKANMLFAPAEENIGFQEFRDSLRAKLQANIFENVRFEDLLDTMERISGVNIDSALQYWNYPTPLPSYIINYPQVTRITNLDLEAYVVKLLITNDSDNKGYLGINTAVGGWNWGYDPRLKRRVRMEPHETVEFVTVWDEAPRNMTVNTLISTNLPGIVTLPINDIQYEENKELPEEGDYVMDNMSYKIQGELIIDNEDSTLFELSRPAIVGLLPKWLEDVGDNSFAYAGISNWRPPLQWTLTTNERYYGTSIRSAYVIKNGSGTQTATWKVPVPERGEYELYFYLTRSDDFRSGGGGGGGGGGNRGGGGGGNRGGGGGGGRGGGGPGGGPGGGGNRGGWGGEEAYYNFKLLYDGDEDKVSVDLRRVDNGWALIGSFQFPKDTVKVTLTNESKQRMITADAMKLVRKW